MIGISRQIFELIFFNPSNGIHGSILSLKLYSVCLHSINGRNKTCREKILKKMVENRLRWFGHVERRPVDVVVRRVDQMEESQIKRGRGRPKKTI